jgi:adenosylcobinamide-phosphate guanylyltransferase
MRRSSSTEKPLININGVPMIERIISALAGSHRFDRIIAIVSPNTPKTKEFLKSKGGDVDIIETTGDGFSQDLSSFLSKVNHTRVLVVPADLPLLNASIVSEIVDVAQTAPAVSIAMKKEFVESIGIKPSVVFDTYCHSGITIFDSAQVISLNIAVQEQHKVMNRLEIAVNVNTKEEADLAEKLLIQHF